MVLARTGSIPIGSRIWAEDEEQVWILAEVVRQESTRLTVRNKKTGEELLIDLVRESSIIVTAVMCSFIASCVFAGARWRVSSGALPRAPVYVLVLYIPGSR